MIKNREEFIDGYWRYYETLEKDFIKTIRYVGLYEDNFGTYSIEYARLLQSICSEIDVIFKELCCETNPKAKKIDDYADAILATDDNFNESIICLKMYNRGYEIHPFKNWKKRNSPVWWTAYNKIKHERISEMKNANLENTLHALSALFYLECYLLAKIVNKANEEFHMPDYPSKLFYQKRLMNEKI